MMNESLHDMTPNGMLLYVSVPPMIFFKRHNKHQILIRLTN